MCTQADLIPHGTRNCPEARLLPSQCTDLVLQAIYGRISHGIVDVIIDRRIENCLDLISGAFSSAFRNGNGKKPA